jgi:3-phosphoshikimate 1-carboxyvinyltransferase
VGINPTRIGFLNLLKIMGANIHQTNIVEKCREPRADILIKPSHLKSFKVKEEIVPSVIDELPILAVAATQAEGTTIVSGAKELRIKESDRIASICSELRKLGADITEKTDGFIINGPTKLKGAVVDSFGDHRLAMALSVAGLVAEGTTTVKNGECIQISFPNFQNMLKEIAC